MYRKDRSQSGGGGVFIAVKREIPSHASLEYSDERDDNESLWVPVRMANLKELHLCAFYKPPNATSSCLDHLSNTILKVFDQNKSSHPNIVIAGDSTLVIMISWNTDPPSNHSTTPLMNCLLDLINSNAVTQHVTQPTHPASLKILDLALSSTPS